MNEPEDTFKVPTVDTLLFVTVTRPGHPIIANLSGEAPAQIVGDRDRAILRALLLLALQRLDNQEKS